MLRFPQREDVHLQRAPLAEVICQVRFPPILRIASEQPAAFQERVRGQFPKLEVQQGMIVQMAPLGTVPPSVQPEPRLFRFKSPDDRTSVSLALEFYALSTTAYTHWRDFSALLAFVSTAAQEIYSLPYATRIGLRYINNLTSENTGANSVADLLNILRPELTALLNQDPWDEPLDMFNQVLLAAGENERLALRTGFRSKEQPDFVLDLDYFVEGNVPLNDIIGLCGRYHDVIYNAFRWCIREDKLAAFGPVPTRGEK